MSNKIAKRRIKRNYEENVISKHPLKAYDQAKRAEHQLKMALLEGFFDNGTQAARKAGLDPSSFRPLTSIERYAEEELDGIESLMQDDEGAGSFLFSSDLDDGYILRPLVFADLGREGELDLNIAFDLQRVGGKGGDSLLRYNFDTESWGDLASDVEMDFSEEQKAMVKDNPGAKELLACVIRQKGPISEALAEKLILENALLLSLWEKANGSLCFKLVDDMSLFMDDDLDDEDDGILPFGVDEKPDVKVWDERHEIFGDEEDEDFDDEEDEDFGDEEDEDFGDEDDSVIPWDPDLFLDDNDDVVEDELEFEKVALVLTKTRFYEENGTYICTDGNYLTLEYGLSGMSHTICTFSRETVEELCEICQWASSQIGKVSERKVAVVIAPDLLMRVDPYEGEDDYEEEDEGSGSLLRYRKGARKLEKAEEERVSEVFFSF